MVALVDGEKGIVVVRFMVKPNVDHLSVFHNNNGREFMVNSKFKSTMQDVISSVLVSIYWTYE